MPLVFVTEWKALFTIANICNGMQGLIGSCKYLVWIISQQHLRLSFNKRDGGGVLLE